MSVRKYIYLCVTEGEDVTGRLPDREGIAGNIRLLTCTVTVFVFFSRGSGSRSYSTYG